MRTNRAAAPLSPTRTAPLHRGLRSRGSPATVGTSRGRPRDPSIDREVETAVLKKLHDGGYRAVTLDGIARKVKRARTSLYRRWPSKRHLVAYAVLSEMGASPARHSGTLRGDLRAAVETLLRAFAGPLRQALLGLVADIAHDGQLADTFR